MFLKFFNLKKKNSATSGIRNIFFLKNFFNLNKIFKKMKFSKKWNAGRGYSGKIIFNKRKSLKTKNVLIKVNYKYRLNRIGIISNFQFLPFKNKILILIFFSNGLATYINATQFNKIFNYIYLNLEKKLNKFNLKSTFFLLFQIKKLSYISLIELKPGHGAQYVRSSGTKAKIIKFDKNNHTVLLQLPSGFKKIFSYYSLAFFGKNVFKLKKKITNNKAGYWRYFGIKSIVRGVAKNPVDHPHGGRTKAIKNQRTPWGKPTKLK